MMNYSVEIVSSKAGYIGTPMRRIDALTSSAAAHYAQELADEEGGIIRLWAQPDLFADLAATAIGTFQPSAEAVARWRKWQASRGISGEFRGTEWIPAQPDVAQIASWPQRMTEERFGPPERIF